MGCDRVDMTISQQDRRKHESDSFKSNRLFSEQPIKLKRNIPETPTNCVKPAACCGAAMLPGT
jgi:hypothetical protein